MNDDAVPDSVDDVFAKAARMGRGLGSANATPPPDEAALKLSLAAVASHARSEVAAAADKSEREALKAVPPPAEARPASRAAAIEPAAVVPAEAVSIWAGPPAAVTKPPVLVPEEPVATEASAEPFTPPSEEIAALHDKFVEPADASRPEMVEAEGITPQGATPVLVPESAAMPDKEAHPVLLEEVPPQVAGEASGVVQPWTSDVVPPRDEAAPVAAESAESAAGAEAAQVVITADGLPVAEPAAAELAKQESASLPAKPVEAAALPETAAAAPTHVAADQPAVSDSPLPEPAVRRQAPLPATAETTRVDDAWQFNMSAIKQVPADEPEMEPQARDWRAAAASAWSRLPRLPRPSRPVLAGTAGILVLGVIAGLVLQRKPGGDGPARQLTSNEVGTAAVTAPKTPAAVGTAPPPATPEVSAPAAVAATTLPAAAAASAAQAPAVIAATEPLPSPVVATAPVTNTSPAQAPVAAAVAPVDQRPLLGLVVEQADVGNTALAEQLLSSWRANGPSKADDLQASGWLAGLAALASGPPRVAVVRYDALQAARRTAVPGAAAQRLPALEVVAPLTLEPVYLVVRADSPMQFVHDIRGKAINAGAAQSSRALTVDTLYRGLFNAPLPAHPLRTQDEKAALEQLAAGKLDVVALVGAASRQGLDAAAAAHGKQFKLLAFDADQPSARNALNSFLPVQAAARSLGSFPAASTPTVGMMSFVVTARQAGANARVGSNGSNTAGPSAASNATPSADPHARAVARLADELCGVRSGGNSGGAQRLVLKGQQRVDPSLQLDVGWPYSSAARAVLSRCGTSGAASRTAATPPGSS